jgi:hypothetical protein
MHPSIGYGESTVFKLYETCVLEFANCSPDEVSITFARCQCLIDCQMVDTGAVTNQL